MLNTVSTAGNSVVQSQQQSPDSKKEEKSCWVQCSCSQLDVNWSNLMIRSLKSFSAHLEGNLSWINHQTKPGSISYPYRSWMKPLSKSFVSEPRNHQKALLIQRELQIQRHCPTKSPFVVSLDKITSRPLRVVKDLTFFSFFLYVTG